MLYCRAKLDLSIGATPISMAKRKTLIRSTPKNIVLGAMTLFLVAEDHNSRER
jgi:hypothetical protein